MDIDRKYSSDKGPRVEFARRLNALMDANGVPPLNKGRLVWLHDALVKRGQDVTIEAVRTWVNGLVKPRENNIRALAEIFKCSISWLDLGVGADETPERSALIDGPTNIVVGLIQLYGGNVAFDERGDSFSSIANGKLKSFQVFLGEPKPRRLLKFSIPLAYNRSATPLGLINDAMKFTLLKFDHRIVESELKLNGIAYEVDVRVSPSGAYLMGESSVEIITNPSDLIS